MDKAVPTYQQLVAAEPLNEGFRGTLAWLYFLSGNFEEGINIWRPLIAQGRGGIWGIVLYAHQDRFNEAIDAGERHLRNAPPDHPEFWVYLGNAYQGAGQHENALRTWAEGARQLEAKFSISDDSHDPRLFEVARGGHYSTSPTTRVRNGGLARAAGRAEHSREARAGAGSDTRSCRGFENERCLRTPPGSSRERGHAPTYSDSRRASLKRLPVSSWSTGLGSVRRAIGIEPVNPRCFRKEFLDALRVRYAERLQIPGDEGSELGIANRVVEFTFRVEEPFRKLNIDDGSSSAPYRHQSCFDGPIQLFHSRVPE
jgi:tetratricopeptide (TPR) repeat protein